MILAAGLGTRLRPLTLHIPKPLFPVLNQPLVERLCLSLQAQGFSSVFINTFHLGELVQEWHSGFMPDSMNVSLVREPELLGTGGGIRNVFAHHCLRDTPLLVINGDVVTDISLKRLYDVHTGNAADTGDRLLASMVVHSREPWNKLHVQDGYVLSFSHEGPDALAFTGISVLSPHFMKKIPQRPGSVISALMTEMERGGRVRAVMAGEVASSGDGAWIWEDIGTPEGYLMAHEALIGSVPGRERIVAAHEAGLPAGFRTGEWVCVGGDAVIGEDVFLSRCVVWPGSVVPAGARFENSIITPYGFVEAAVHMEVS